jgi:hypothetical protein
MVRILFASFRKSSADTEKVKCDSLARKRNKLLRGRTHSKRHAECVATLGQHQIDRVQEAWPPVPVGKRQPLQHHERVQVLGEKRIAHIVRQPFISGPKGIQRVLTENGITYAILGERSGASKRLKKAASEGGALLPLFVAPSQLKPFISKELEDGPLKPIDYQDGDRIVRGYDAAVLVVVCNIWLSARQAGALQAQQLPKAQKAELLTRALAETGIVALVDEATGYEKVRPQNALQRYLEILVRKELAAWAKKFPDEFYENIYRLKGWKWPGMGKNRYSVVAYYTRDLVYERLGPGLLNELESKSPKNGDGHRPSRLHQTAQGIFTPTKELGRRAGTSRG